jgi:hypothetical protein
MGECFDFPATDVVFLFGAPFKQHMPVEQMTPPNRCLLGNEALILEWISSG